MSYGGIFAPLNGRLVVACCHVGQQIGGASSCDHAVCDGVGVLLIGVTSATDATPELHAGALLDNMSGLVRGRV